MPNYSVVAPTVPGGPTFLRGPGLVEIRIPVLPKLKGQQVDAQQIANAINSRMAVSWVYASQLADSFAVAEGATLWFKGSGSPKINKVLS